MRGQSTTKFAVGMRNMMRECESKETERPVINGYKCVFINAKSELKLRRVFDCIDNNMVYNTPYKPHARRVL